MDVRNLAVELKERDKMWNAIICCTASHRVEGVEGSEEGYIQGAGDDSEGWSCGLTPEVFWENKAMLMGASEGSAEGIVKRLMKERTMKFGAVGRDVREGKEIVVGGKGMVCVGMLDAIGGEHEDGKIVIALTRGVEEKEKGTLDNCLHLRLPDGKAGSRAFREKLCLLRGFLPAAMGSHSPPLGKILCVCPTGKDLSIGVALMVVCLYFDEDGRLPQCPFSSYPS